MDFQEICQHTRGAKQLMAGDFWPKQNRFFILYTAYTGAVFFGTGGIATIKHRCVTHLCGSNAIGRVHRRQRAVDMSEFGFIK